MNLLEQFRADDEKRNIEFAKEQKERNEIAKAFEDAERKFKEVNRMDIRVQLLHDGKDIKEEEYKAIIGEQVTIMCNKIQDLAHKNLTNAERELKKILGLWKPATTNQDIEEAVQEMLNQKNEEIPQIEEDDACEIPFAYTEEEQEGKPWLDKDKLYEEYITNNKTATQIAREWGTNKSNVYQNLSKFGIKKDDFVPGKQDYSKKKKRP